MPVGPWETFGDCVAALKARGKSADSARRICGSIEKKTKQRLEMDILIFTKQIEMYQTEIELLNAELDEMSTKKEEGERNAGE